MSSVTLLRVYPGGVLEMKDNNQRNLNAASHDTKELIKREFLKEYHEKSLEKIKVSVLVSACNISRGTFYFYFTDVQRLYKECEQDIIGFMEEGMNEIIMSTIRGNSKRHIDLYAAYLERYIPKKDLLKDFIAGSEAVSFHEALTKSVYDSYISLLEFSSEIPESHKNMMALYHSNGWASVLSAWVENGCVVPARQVSEILSRALFKGIY